LASGPERASPSAFTVDRTSPRSSGPDVADAVDARAAPDKTRFARYDLGASSKSSATAPTSPATDRGVTREGRDDGGRKRDVDVVQRDCIPVKRNRCARRRGAVTRAHLHAHCALQQRPEIDIPRDRNSRRRRDDSPAPAPDRSLGAGEAQGIARGTRDAGIEKGRRRKPRGGDDRRERDRRDQDNRAPSRSHRPAPSAGERELCAHCARARRVR
jgi:hypothetical protein